MDFDGFAQSQYGRLVASLTLYCGDRWVAEELAQDALVRAHERWEAVREMEAPGAWLNRVAMNLANSWYRRLRAQRRSYARCAESPESHEDGSAEAVAIRTAVASLPPTQRAVLILRYFLDLPVADVASVMGMTSGSVKSATHRALVGLRRDFEVDDVEEAEDGR